MFNTLILILTLFVGIGGLYFVLFLWSNAGLESVLKEFSSLRFNGKMSLMERPTPSWYYNVSKRALDVLFALIVLVALSPILVIISVLLAMESGGPILYRQRRLGLNGKYFGAYKFRTMRPADEDDATSLPRRSDPRITRVGSVLRITALDELPALINVLKGDVSLVGRSRILDYTTSSLNLSQEERDALLSIRPGVISLWMLSRNRVDFNFDHIRDYDIYYLGKMSFDFDLKILIGAMVVMLGLTSQH